MNKREIKKDHILCAGIEVMRTCGYNGTSVKNIVDAAGVPKGSFYNYFDSKENFAIEALEKVASEDVSNSRKLLFQPDKTALERLQYFFETAVEQACEGDFKAGCFIGNLCQEMSDTNDLIRSKVRILLNRNTSLFSELLEEAIAKGELSDNIDPTTVSEFILNAWEGTLMRMKAAKSKQPLDAFLGMLPVILR